MRAIVDACRGGEINAEVAIIVSPKDDTPAVVWARERGLNVRIVPPGDDEGPRLLEAMDRIELLCLAGFLRLLPNEVLSKFKQRILNIHPALLPKFGGKGMYGMHVHEAVLAAGDAESGCTVHQVTERYDEGEIVVQLRCPIEAGDTPETLAARVLDLEHRAYPMAIRKVLDG